MAAGKLTTPPHHKGRHRQKINEAAYLGVAFPKTKTFILIHFLYFADRRPVVISGPSGVGKGTLYNLLFQRHPDAFCLSVSHTTRGPRPGEKDGEHYHFVPMQDFEDLIAKDGFVEHAKFGGNRYGTSKMTIEEQTKKGRIVLLDIEMEVRTRYISFYSLAGTVKGGTVVGV